MAFARKIPAKKMSLVTYADFFNVLWKMFPSSSKGCDRIDVVFDLYLENSIKEDERHRRSKAQPIETNIATPKQQLPVWKERFWSSSSNKIKLQQAFIVWMISNIKVDVPVFLGGANAEIASIFLMAKQLKYPALKMITRKPMIACFSI